MIDSEILARLLDYIADYPDALPPSRNDLMELARHYLPEPQVGGPMPAPWPGMGVEVRGNGFIAAYGYDENGELFFTGAPPALFGSMPPVYGPIPHHLVDVIRDGRRIVWKRA